MPALRTLGLVILAAFVVSIGTLGYAYMRAVQDEATARNAALSVANKCEEVINSPPNSVRTVEINLPGNYHMHFFDNQIVVGGYRVPEGGLMRRFAENAPELGPGPHQLSITIDENNKLVITRI